MNEKLATEDYKIIPIELEEPLSDLDASLLKGLFASCDARELAYELDENEFVLFLNAIDLDAFKEKIACATAQSHSQALNALFEKTLDEIERIKSYGLKNGKRVYVGYDRERKVLARKEKETRRQQHYYANENDFSETNNPLPAEFENQIICGDSEEILKRLPDNCVDLVFTSPPYNFGLDYEANGDAHYWEHYFDKLFAIFDECARVLKFGGRIVVNIQPLFSDYIPSHHIISNFFIGKRLIWKGEILWEKNNYNCKYTAWGSWKSPSNPYLKYTWEFLEIFAKGTLKKDGAKENIDLTADEFKKWVVAKWSIAPERQMKDYDHPAMFPEELAKRVLKLFSFQNDVVLDPFNGVGTTTYVAKMTNRRYLGIDISREYCEKATHRLGNTLF